MKVHFRLGRLGSKLDALMCRWHIYMEGDDPEAIATNIRPVFTSDQLTEVPVLACTGSMEDPTPINTLDQDVCTTSITKAYTEDDCTLKLWEQIRSANQPDRWMEREGCLLFHERLYVPNKGMLCLHTIYYHHDHPTMRHFEVTKTTELIHCKYNKPV